MCYSCTALTFNPRPGTEIFLQIVAPKVFSIVIRIRMTCLFQRNVITNGLEKKLTEANVSLR